MNKKVLIVGALGALTLAGCQNLEEQIGNKIAEGIINTATQGEVKVDFDDLQKGKVNVTTKEGTISLSGDESGGSLKMTDASGKTLVDASGADGKFTVKDESGKEIMSGSGGEGGTVTIKGDGGDSVYQSSVSGRPANAPADLPSVDGGENFAYMSAGDTVSLTYSVKGTDLKGICGKQGDLLAGAGWAVATGGFSMESEETVSKSYEKGDNTLLMSCGAYDGQVSVTLNQTKKS